MQATNAAVAAAVFVACISLGCSTRESPGPSCGPGTCVPQTLVNGMLASEQNRPRNIAVDAANVYWIHHVSLADGGLAREIVACAKTGCQTPTIVASIGGSLGLASDTTHLYWTENWSGTVMTVASAGGTPMTLASGQSGAVGVAVDKTQVYWSTDTLYASPPAPNPAVGLFALPVGGGTPTPLIASLPSDVTAIATDGVNVYWAESGSAALGEPNGAIVKISVSGGAATTLASGLVAPASIAVDANYVYWTGGTPLTGGAAKTGTVMRVPVGGGAPVTIADGQDAATGIAVWDGMVYWTNSGSSDHSGSIVQVLSMGGAAVTLASGQAGAGWIAVDGTGIYWINSGCPVVTNPSDPCMEQGQVMALHPK